MQMTHSLVTLETTSSHHSLIAQVLFVHHRSHLPLRKHMRKWHTPIDDSELISVCLTPSLNLLSVSLITNSNELIVEVGH